jgi:hypothetical protein
MNCADLSGIGGFMSTNPDGRPSTLRDILDGVRRELDPGEVILAGCDARVTAKVEFLQHPRAERSPYVSHFLAVTDRRVLVFSISPKAFTQGLAAPAVLRYQAPRDTVCVAQFKQKALTGRLRLQCAAGMVPFEVNRQTRDILAKIAGLLPSCGAHA